MQKSEILGDYRILFILDQLWKTSRWKTVDKGGHLKSRAAPDPAMVWLMSPFVGLASVHQVEQSLHWVPCSPPCILSFYWRTVRRGCTCIISKQTPSVQVLSISFSSSRCRPFLKMHNFNFFLKTLFPVKLCRQVNCRISIITEMI